MNPYPISGKIRKSIPNRQKILCKNRMPPRKLISRVAPTSAAPPRRPIRTSLAKACKSMRKKLRLAC